MYCIKTKKMKSLIRPVGYLENKDFDDEGNIINEELMAQRKPIFIMIQANFCGHCTVSKPDFQAFAEKYQDIITCCTIQGDSPRDQELAQKIRSIYPGFRGFPSYIAFGDLYRKPNERQIVDVGRSMQDFEKFFGLI